MKTSDVIRLARLHLNGNSASLALADAIASYDAGEFTAAHRRALRSLAHSVGAAHPDYIRAARRIPTTSARRLEP